MQMTVPRPVRAALLAVVIASVTTACDSGTATAPATGAGVPSPSTAPSTSAAAPSASGSSPAGPGGDGTGDRPDLAAVRIELAPVVSDLAAPVFVTGPPDGSGRLFVVEQGGVIRVVRDGVLLDEPFIDLSSLVQAGGERGLLGLAFPPGYGAGRRDFYVHFSDRNGDTVVAQVQTRADDPDRADPASVRTILTQAQPYANHNGGWIGFDADGMLLIGLGDGGAGGDPENRASDLGTILGKILRIDVLGATGDTLYRIPADNPFVGADGARGEILHYGLRNPFRASIDPVTGDLWIGDVGQSAWEEVDVAPAAARGLDFGWRRWEGRHCYDEAAGCDPTGVTMPVAEYPHAEGCSVIGGVVYRGTAIPALRGAYLYSDFCSGTLWAIDAGIHTAQAPIVLAETGRSISSIGVGANGEVYLTDLGGTLLELTAG